MNVFCAHNSKLTKVHLIIYESPRCLVVRRLKQMTNVGYYVHVAAFEIAPSFFAVCPGITIIYTII